MLVTVAEVVLAELSRHIALLLDQVGDSRRPVGDAMVRTWHTDGQQPGAERMLAKHERGAAGGAGLLTVGVGEYGALFSDAVDVRRAVAHDATIVGTDVVNPNVVAPDDENVRFLLLCLCIYESYSSEREY